MGERDHSNLQSREVEKQFTRAKYFAFQVQFSSVIPDLIGDDFLVGSDASPQTTRRPGLDPNPSCIAADQRSLGAVTAVPCIVRGSKLISHPHLIGDSFPSREPQSLPRRPPVRLRQTQLPNTSHRPGPDQDITAKPGTRQGRRSSFGSRRIPVNWTRSASFDRPCAATSIPANRKSRLTAGNPAPCCQLPGFER